jgi:carboxymethylenebutenolidase
MGRTISRTRPDGRSVAGYLAEPAHAEGAPGMVVIQEWWGLNDQIEGVAAFAWQRTMALPAKHLR